MDVGTMAESAVRMRSDQTQQAMAISLMKMAANQQNLLAAMLNQGAQQGAQIAAQSDYGFSVYA